MFHRQGSDGRKRFALICRRKLAETERHRLRHRENVMTLMPARILHVSIARDWEEVYEFAADPARMGLWAAGLAAGLTRDGEDWIGDGGPIGRIRIRFATPNPHGVLDHTVTMADGTVVSNPLRVVQNGDGAEVMFTLFQRPNQDEAPAEADAVQIMEDLNALKRLMEEPI
jgi:hypothetical protein